MSPEGLGSSGVLIVSDQLGAREAQDSLPLRPNSPSGSVFQGIIRRISGLDRSQLLLSNTIWCQPGAGNWLDGAPYEASAIEHCQQYNRKLIADRRPRAIVALGAIPTRTITGMAGYNQGIKLIRGYILQSSRPEYFVDGKPIPVIATYHPSFLLRGSKTRSKDKEAQSGGMGGKVEKAQGGMTLAGVVTRDIELALNIAKVGFRGYRKFNVIKGDRNVMDNIIRLAEEHPEWDLAWDIETPRSIASADDESEIDVIKTDVHQIQFAFDQTTGYVFPGFRTEWVKEGSRRLLAGRNRKLTWNGWKFDDRVVAGHGLVINGENVDLMAAWSWIQPDLPKGLQFATSFYAPDLAPWKHKAGGFGEDVPWADAKEIADMDYYGTCDVISLHMDAEGIFSVMDQRGLRNSFNRHVLMLRPEMILASKRGFPIDEEKHKIFGEKILSRAEEINTQIQSLIPEAILNLEPKRKKKGAVAEYGYVNTPKQLLSFLDLSGNPVDGSGRIVITESVPVLGDDGEPVVPEQLEERKVVYSKRDVEVFNKQTLDVERLSRWCRIIPFSVGSGPQKIKYIEYKHNEEVAKRMAKGQSRSDAERLTKYQVPKVRDKKDKELKDNTGAKEMEKLAKATGDPVFGMLVEISKLKKFGGTYYTGLKEQIRSGYIHSTFNLADTATGQLSSTEPNVQNFPKHGDLAKEFRMAICAKPGKRLIEIDKKSFHAQTLAFEAKDHAYARLSAIDVHSYMTAFRLKLPEAKDLMSWSDKDLKLWIKEKKNDTRLYPAEAIPNYTSGCTFQQVRDYKSKRVILGIGFSQGARSIYEQNPESYKSAKEVQEFLDLFSETFPQVRKYQKEITQLAHKQTYLISRWGYIRRFYDVFKWDSSKWNKFTNSMGDWSQGDDFESAVAFFPANDAFGMIKEEMLRSAGYRLGSEPFLRTHIETQRDGGYFEDRPMTDAEWKNELERYYEAKKMLAVKESEDYFQKYNFINQIHDSLIFHTDVNLVEKCLEDELTIMREPCLSLTDPEMAPNGLFVDAEPKVGENWADYDEKTGNLTGMKGVAA
jgi:uracil-DNA glycosylase family 4